ncbi:MAG: hypothetical protein CSA21_05105 [Deltaproteobacteria bacterium]|nr:MAG: hypothetical protein CSA21_05105 [Deltaproteobacteria bacterium]
MRMSIKLKIMLGLLIPLILVVSITFALSARDITTQSTHMLLKGVSFQLKGIEQALSTFLNEAKLNTRMMALDHRASDTEHILTNYLSSVPAKTAEAWPEDIQGKALRAFYKTILQSHESYEDAYMGTHTGATILGYNNPLPPGYDPRKRDWYKDASLHPDEVGLSPAYQDILGEAMISSFKAISKNGQIVGVAAIDISLNKITSLVQTVRLGQKGFAILFQDDGTILANPHDKETNFQNITDAGNEIYARLFKADKDGLLVTLDKQEYQATSYTSPSLGWKIVGLIPQQEIMAPIYATLTRLALIFVSSLLAISVFIWFFIDKATVTPLNQVVTFLGTIRRGEYDDTIDHTRKDEIGEIFTALNETAATLKKSMQEINTKTEEAEKKTLEAQEATAIAETAAQQAEKARSEGMRQAGSQLEDTTLELKQDSANITKETDKIHDGTQIQKERIQSTVTAMEEMNSTVMEVAKNAASASENAQEAKDMADHGAVAVNKSVNAINAIQKEAAGLRENMGELEAKAQEIGNIMGVITDIADQTNLLALNAAIEAARAGEAGRGFAVVADEVRKLAEKTMSATKEVGDSISAIQSVTQQNANAMSKTVTDLEEATKLANSSGEALQKIVQGAEMTADQIQSIATAAEEQSATSEEIANSLEDINRIATETQANVLETRERILSLNTQVDSLTELVLELKAS